MKLGGKNRVNFPHVGVIVPSQWPCLRSNLMLNSNKMLPSLFLSLKNHEHGKQELQNRIGCLEFWVPDITYYIIFINTSMLTLTKFSRTTFPSIMLKGRKLALSMTLNRKKVYSLAL